MATCKVHYPIGGRKKTVSDKRKDTYLALLNSLRDAVGTIAETCCTCLRDNEGDHSRNCQHFITCAPYDRVIRKAEKVWKEWE